MGEVTNHDIVVSSERGMLRNKMYTISQYPKRDCQIGVENSKLVISRVADTISFGCKSGCSNKIGDEPVALFRSMLLSSPPRRGGIVRVSGGLRMSCNAVVPKRVFAVVIALAFLTGVYATAQVTSSP